MPKSTKVANGQKLGALAAQALMGAWRSDPAVCDLPDATLSKIYPNLASVGGGGMLYQRCQARKDLAQYAQMQQGFKSAVLNNAVSGHAIAEVSQMLREAGIEHLLFKGASLSRYYGDAACRGYGDIDILVRPAQMAAVLDVLVPQSFARDNPDFPFDRNNIVVTLDWQYPAHMSKVDLHENLDKFHLPDLNAVFAHAGHMEIAGAQVPVMGAEHLLRLACLHGLRHGFWRAVWLVDIAAFVENLPADFNWELCLQGDATLRNWIGVCLGLAQQLLGADMRRVPAGVVVPPPKWARRVVLRDWSKSFTQYHDRKPLKAIIRQRPSSIGAQLVHRWPNPMMACLRMGTKFPMRFVVLVQLRYLWARLFSDK
ncbi:hypothetical protein GCM10007939_10320 [Amylibacter marinus]|uniref:Nucleotidyltransferase family protein n=1 Tax=Amylibacter marinus TaxID=1475483 RepID=A0ABQ5VTU3_9RHOB|nr:nucleotidyltransferase family protein [Amylibacter marinus]GLQ34749.1 hypothetical protein GCM10007939_10320 [Amylibacter marinus]